MRQRVLLVSSGLVHPSLLARFWLRRALAAAPGYDVRRASSLEALVGMELSHLDAIVLYVHQESLSAAALGRLAAFVAGGGGLLALHAASASFKEADGYFEILGGRFVTHGPVETFRVAPTRSSGLVPTRGVDDELFGGVPAFTVRDELYRHEYEPDNWVHLITNVEGEAEPVVWTRHYPDAAGGRVCYCALGHTVAAVRHPQTQQIVRRGLAWVCRRGAGA